MHFTQLYFNQTCPVCGRKMRVRIEFLGEEIACGHCTAVTVACDNSDHPRAGSHRLEGHSADPVLPIAKGSSNTSSNNTMVFRNRP